MHGYELFCNALLALLQRFADAENYIKAGIECCAYALVYRLVCFSEISSALAVADNYVLHAHGSKHGSGNLACKGA